MDTKMLMLGSVAILYGVGALFFRNTHPYSTRNEPFESKQQRRRIGTFLVAVATLLLGITGLVQFMLSKG